MHWVLLLLLLLLVINVREASWLKAYRGFRGVR